MPDATPRHIVDESLGEPGSYFTIARGDRVYDLYGWEVGTVAELRIAGTRDQHFDGLVVDFRGVRLFVDAPEVRAIHPGVVMLTVTVSDLTDAAHDPSVPPGWPDGPPQVQPRPAAGAAEADDAVALMAALSRMYVASRVELGTLELDVERVLAAGSCAELDAIATELLPPPQP